MSRTYWSSKSLVTLRDVRKVGQLGNDSRPLRFALDLLDFKKFLEFIITLVRLLGEWPSHSYFFKKQLPFQKDWVLGLAYDAPRR